MYLSCSQKLMGSHLKFTTRNQTETLKEKWI